MAALSGAWRYRVSAGTGWPGVMLLGLGEMERFDLQLPSQCGSTSSCLSRSVPEIHWHVAGTLSDQRTTIPSDAWRCRITAGADWLPVSAL